jgi:hypothetical protein
MPAKNPERNTWPDENDLRGEIDAERYTLLIK